MRVRWIFVAVLTMALINGVRSQITTPAPGGARRRNDTPETPVPTPASSSLSEISAGTEAPTVCGDGVEGTATGSSGDDLTICCGNSCDSCSDEGCGNNSDTNNCCPETIINSTVSCDDAGPPCTYGSGKYQQQWGVPTPVPSASTEPTDSADTETPTVCSVGIEGTTTDLSGDDVVICCGNSCVSCSDAEGCGNGGSDECCPEVIFTSAVSCDYTGPPCIYSGDNDDEDSAISDDSDSGTSAGVIALGVVLAAVVLGNAVYCCMFKRREKPPTAVPPVLVRDRNAEAAEMGRLQNADVEIRRLKEDLASERNRRMKADDIILRAKGGGIRPGDFPSVRDVDLHLENLPGDAIKWAENACAILGTHPALPKTVRSVLESTFLVCREEVKQCFDERLQSLSGFLGNDEPVMLSGGDTMNLDTQYVLYECLRRNFETIVPTDPDHVKQLADMVQQRSGGSEADGKLAGDIIFGNAWPSFDNLVKKCIMVFVEMALQQPAMEFRDDLGESRTYDPVLHRDWAPHLKGRMERCCVVFPAILEQEGRPKSNAKIGVVRLPA